MAKQYKIDATYLQSVIDWARDEVNKRRADKLAQYSKEFAEFKKDAVANYKKWVDGLQPDSSRTRSYRAYSLESDLYPPDPPESWDYDRDSKHLDELEVLLKLAERDLAGRVAVKSDCLIMDWIMRYEKKDKKDA